MEENSLGRLLKTLKERCPLCNHVLQLRARTIPFVAGGVDMTDEEEYICCSNCEYERETEVRKRRERVDKTSLFVETPLVNERSKKNDRHQERGATKRDFRKRD